MDEIIELSEEDERLEVDNNEIRVVSYHQSTRLEAGRHKFSVDSADYSDSLSERANTFKKEIIALDPGITRLEIEYNKI